ncbi:MAG: hypothetical protein AAB520_03840, partial [Patescibacteria group bacterium]
MGKIRLKTIGDEGLEEAEKAKKAIKKAEKKARNASEEEQTTGNTTTQTSENQTPELTVSGGQTEVESAQAETKQPKKEKKAKFAKKSRGRSSNYSAKILEIDKNKTYSLAEALELLRKMQNLPRLTESQGGFDETVELHINTTEAGING